MQEFNPIQPVDSMIGKLLVASTMVQDPMLARSVCLVVHQDAANVYGVLLNRPMLPPKGIANWLSTAESCQDAGRSLGDRRTRPINANPHPYPPNLPNPEASQFKTQGGDQTRRDKTSGELSSPVPAAEKGKQVRGQHTITEAAKSLGMIHFGGPLSGPVVAVHNSSEHAEAETGRGVYVAAQRDLLETLVKQKPGQFRLIVGHLGWSVDQLRAERDAGFWHIIDATDDDVFVGDQALWPSVIRRATTASVANWLGIRDVPFAAEVN